jgi:hypothetical protein
MPFPELLKLPSSPACGQPTTMPRTLDDGDQDPRQPTHWREDLGRMAPSSPGPVPERPWRRLWSWLAHAGNRGGAARSRPRFGEIASGIDE